MRFLPQIRLFPLALIAYAALFYLLITDGVSWIVYGLLIFILIERLIMQLGIFLAQHMATQLVQRAMANAAAMSQQHAHGPQDDLPPMTGGRIDPPE